MVRVVGVPRAGPVPDGSGSWTTIGAFGGTKRWKVCRAVALGAGSTAALGGVGAAVAQMESRTLRRRGARRTGES